MTIPCSKFPQLQSEKRNTAAYKMSGKRMATRIIIKLDIDSIVSCSMIAMTMAKHYNKE